MRKLGWLILLGLALFALHHFTAGAELPARATLALGTLVALAELSSRLAGHWRLPGVSGAIAVGALFGPSLVRPDEAVALGFLGDAAIALFAFRAGLAMRGDAQAGPSGDVRYFVTSLVVPFALTAAVVYAVHPWFPLTVHQPTGDALSVALVLGAFTVVAAPGLTWITLVDAPGGAAGEAFLRLHVWRDILAVALFAALLALARPLASAGAVHPTAFGGPLLALAASALAGALLAWLTSRYHRLLGTDAAVMLVAIGFGAAVVGALGRGEATLTALFAGIFLARTDRGATESFSRRFDARGTALSAAAFVLLGIRLDVTGLPDLWPWVLLLAVIRAVGLYGAGRWAARGPLVTAALARGGWLGLISQGGLGVVLAAMGRRAFPEWGVSFETLAVAVVTVHAIVGPICLRRVLAQRPAHTEGVSGVT